MTRRLTPLALLTDARVIAALFAIVTVVSTVQKLLRGAGNNFFIFKYSFIHLLARQDIYILHPEHHLDLFKYSPAFAVLMAPFAPLPNFWGAVAWNLFNLLLLLLGLYLLPLSTSRRAFVYWFIFLEILLSLQNFQSNGLMAGLLLLAFVALEKEKPCWAALAIALSIAVKIFGLVMLPILLCYPRKWKTAAYLAFWLAVLTLLPLALAPFSYLKFLYASWWKLLQWDNSASLGLSVIGLCKTYLGLRLPNLAVQGAGALLLLAPLLRRAQYKIYAFRLTWFCAMLIWIIIFNHKAESPTFIIALVGIAVWGVAQKQSVPTFVTLAVILVFTTLIATDLVPRLIRQTIVAAYALKAWPAVISWLIIESQLLFKKFSDPPISNPSA